MSSKGSPLSNRKASVGSPSARRLTRSTPTGSRDLRKRGNISSESKTAQGSGRRKRIKNDDSSPNESVGDNNGSDSSTDVDPNSETDCEDDAEKKVETAASQRKKKTTRIESNSEEKTQSMSLVDALKNENNSEEELADRVKKKGRIKAKKRAIESDSSASEDDEVSFKKNVRGKQKMDKNDSEQVKVRRFERISEDLSEKTPVKLAEKPPVKTAEKVPVKTAEKSPEKVTQTTQTTKSPEISKKMCIKCKNAEGTCDFLVDYQPYFDKWENPLQTNLLKAICENCQGCIKMK